MIEPRTTARGASPAPRATPRLRAWLIGFAVWTALALVSATDTAFYLWTAGEPIRWSGLLTSRLSDWYSCAVFTPVFFWMVRRWPLERSRVRAVAIYAAITMVCVVLKYAAHVPVMNALLPAEATPMELATVIRRSFVRENIAFWCMLAVVLSVEYWRTLREREIHAARLATQLAEARLDALAAQLHPHFLFNTIQGISTLIHRDPLAADAMLARLSALLRHTLQRRTGHETTLAEELQLLDLYLDIARVRFGERLSVTTAVPHDLLEAMVPHFLLQPLVENALHHGIARRAGAGRVDIAARTEGDHLVISVGDDGPGLDAGAKAFPRDGIGLANTRDRLAQLYGDRQSLDVVSGPDGGFTVAVRIPLHSVPVPE